MCVNDGWHHSNGENPKKKLHTSPIIVYAPLLNIHVNWIYILNSIFISIRQFIKTRKKKNQQIMEYTQLPWANTPIPDWSLLRECVCVCVYTRVPLCVCVFVIFQMLLCRVHRTIQGGPERMQRLIVNFKDIVIKQICFLFYWVENSFSNKMTSWPLLLDKAFGY